MQLSAREARQRDARLARQLARDRLDLRYLLRGKNGAGDPTALDPQDQPSARARSDFASGRQPRARYPSGPRSRHCSTRRPRKAPAWPAAPSCAAACNTPPAARARHAPRRSRRSRRDAGPSPHSFDPTPAVPSPTQTELTAETTKPESTDSRGAAPPWITAGDAEASTMIGGSRL